MQILSGRITCAIQTSFTDVYTSGGGTSRTTYYDQQVLSWSWTNTPPVLVSSSPQVFSVLWRTQEVDPRKDIKRPPIQQDRFTLKTRTTFGR